MPYTKAISPVSNSYLTKGKEYDIVWIDEDVSEDIGVAFEIKDDTGMNIFTLQHGSWRTNGLSWQLK